MENLKRYNRLTEYLKEKFGERTLKICIDGGFTCPNRDGKCGYGGCIFCGERGSGEHLKSVEISKQVDLMIVIGGKNSSNTKKLYEIASNNCKKAILIESKDELLSEDFNKFEKIGVTAGASTPKESIEEVIDLLNLKS